MFLNYWVFATISIILLAGVGNSFLTAISATPLEIVEKASSQITTINLSAETLKQPYWLTIRTSGASQIKGQISLNGKVIQLLNGSTITFNLSPRLKVGKQTIAITGKYSPAEVFVIIELKGNNTQVRQQTSGSGLLNQVLIVEVR